MKASRLLSVLLLLQNRGRMTADELAAELEVSVRTVYRDIEALSGSGVPVYAERGRIGGYRLVEGYRTRLTGMTEQEVQALALAGLPGAAAELGLQTVLTTAQLKLHAALPAELRAGAGRLAERFHLDVPGWFRGIESPPCLTEVAEAVWQQHGLNVRYRRWNNSEVTRLLQPLGLILKGGTWYLAARCDGTTRTYRVSRVLGTDRSEPFQRPPDFDLAHYWEQWSEGFERRLYPRVAVVRLSPRGQAVLPFYLGPAGARALVDAEPDDDGWVQVALPVESGAPALGQLLRFGPELEVLSPADLREQVADAARRTSGFYG